MLAHDGHDSSMHFENLLTAITKGTFYPYIQFISVLFTMAKKRNQPRYPLTEEYIVKHDTYTLEITTEP